MLIQIVFQTIYFMEIILTNMESLRITTIEVYGRYTTISNLDDFNGNGSGKSVKESLIKSLGSLLNEMGKDKVFGITTAPINKFRKSKRKFRTVIIDSNWISIGNSSQVILNRLQIKSAASAVMMVGSVIH